MINLYLLHSDPSQLEYHDKLFKFLSKDGNKITFKDWLGRLHRDGDLPAVINFESGITAWYRHGHPHRDNGPAFIDRYGNKAWYQKGQLHRDGDLPATDYANGEQAWYQRDDLHRDGDKPALIHADGTEEYYVKGIRVNPPAKGNP